MCNKMKIKKGDLVIVTTGKDKGKKGHVLAVSPKENKVVVEAVNVAKKHTKPSMSSAGGILSKEMPIHVSNVSLIDPKSDKATKIGFKFLNDGSKVRFAKASGEVLEA